MTHSMARGGHFHKADNVVLHRLKAEQMEAVFERKKRLLPRPTDLSFYNWDTQMATSNATANFQVQFCCEYEKICRPMHKKFPNLL